MGILAWNRLTFSQMEHSTMQCGLLPEYSREPQQQGVEGVLEGRKERGGFA